MQINKNKSKSNLNLYFQCCNEFIFRLIEAVNFEMFTVFAKKNRKKNKKKEEKKSVLHAIFLMYLAVCVCL